MARRQPILFQGAPGSPHAQRRTLSDPRANLFRDLPVPGGATERFEDLFAAPGVRIERIVSTGQSTPPGEWLQQAWDEWVLLVAGSAKLRIDGADERVLVPGDWLLLPAGTRHRVERTDPHRPTIWLAIHIGEPPAP